MHFECRLLYNMSRCCLIVTLLFALSSALCYVLIKCFVFLNCSFCVYFLVLYVCFLFCVLCFCIVSCIFSPMCILVCFIFVYKFTAHCHRVETQFQLINIIYRTIYIYIISHRIYLIIYHIYHIVSHHISYHIIYHIIL